MGQNRFFRLAYRLTVGGSDQFKTLANRILPLSENQLDEADEDTLRQALAPLWGLRQNSKNAYVGQWVYSRLTDANDNTYPRSLIMLLNKAKEIELNAKQGRSPSDRILRWSALTEGLTAASEERCNALKNEYTEYAAFFEQINALNSLFKKEDLEALWIKTIQSEKPDSSFESFVIHLEQIGLIAVKKYNKRYDYSIANLYIDGFGIQRQQGQRK